MFMRCTSLVGGQGTVYNYTHADKTYAHIDGGTSNPGYLSTPPEAYACYTSSNATLTFYFDNHRSNREGTTYDLNTGGISPVWMTNGTYDNVTKVVFDPSLAGVRLATTFGWLYRMTKLKTIEGMSYLNTSEVTNMAWMFYCCSGLTSLDLSNFNTSKVAQMDYMFGECSNLQTIYVGDGWSTAAVTESDLMFDGCTKLVGGQGTTYNANHVDKTYARIDGGTSNPGYFTYKKPSGIATDLHQVTSDKSQVTSDDWYTIDGRKLNGMPAKKGVYIQNGQKRIIK
jgi:surface protein